MNLQARVHRRLQRHRVGPVPSGPAAVSAPGLSLLDYLATGADAAAAGPGAPAQPELRAAALALLHSNEPLRLGLRAGELAARLGWFERLLALWPADEREQWLHAQLRAAQRHALAGSPLHDALDARLFDPALRDGQRLRLQALWLAVVAPGAVSLDAGRREREQAQALALLAGWLGT